MRWLVLLVVGCTPPAERPRAVDALDCGSEPATHALADGTHLTIDRDGHRVWRGDCARPAATKLIIASPTTRFAGAPAPDGRALVYADRGAIWSLDLATARTRPIYTTPQIRDNRCGHATPPPRGYEAIELVDAVAGFADGGATLVLRRSVVGCELEGQGVYEVRVTDFANPSKARAHPAHPIYDVAAAGPTLYMIDGTGLSRSRDRGATWQPLHPTSAGVPFALLADAHALVVLTSDNGPTRTTDGPATDIIGGALHRSDDDGVTWRTLAIPPELVNPCSIPHGGACIDGRGVEWLAAPTGHLDSLVIGGEPVDATWTSHDGGATWTRGAGRAPHRSRSAQLGTDAFEATADGLVRIRDHVRETITPELSEPYLVDRF